MWIVFYWVKGFAVRGGEALFPNAPQVLESFTVPDTFIDTLGKTVQF